MEKLLDYLIPVIAVIVTYICGRLQSKSNYGNNQMQLRYNEFYVLYLKQLYTCSMYDIDYSTYTSKTRETIIQIPLDNIQHLGIKSQELFPEYYYAHAVLQTTKPNDPELGEIKARCDKAFREFTQAVIEESKDLSNKLKLPELAHTYELRYNQSKNKREHQ